MSGMIAERLSRDMSLDVLISEEARMVVVVMAKRKMNIMFEDIYGKERGDDIIKLFGTSMEDKGDIIRDHSYDHLLIHISSQGLGRPEEQVFRHILKCAEQT